MTSIFRAAVPGALSFMTTPSRGPEPGRHALRALLLLLSVLALVVAAAPAAASAAPKSCGEKVIDDWFDGRIDGTYDLHCYDDAIEQLPRDVRDYSSAKEDIERALQARLRGEKPLPNSDPSITDDGDQSTVGAVPGDDDSGPTSGDDPEAIPSGSAAAENASSVPLPLILLAVLALLLLVGGAAGYVVRRMQARRVTPPAL